MINKLPDCEVIRENNIKPDYTFKLVIVGESGVGKSCLAIRAVSETFESKSTPTIGFDFFHFNVKISNKTIINLKIWDTCGQEKYKSLITSFYEKSSVAILVYAIDNRESFYAIEDWIKQLKTCSSPDCKIILIASKNDLESERLVSQDEGRELQKLHHFDFYLETSAKTGLNVEELFKQIAAMLYIDQISSPTQRLDPNLIDIMKLKKDPKQLNTNSKKCCGKTN